MLLQKEGIQRLETCQNNWPEAYYEEVEEAIRFQMLEKIKSFADIDDQYFEFRKELWEYRYGKRKGQKTEIDYFIRSIVYLKSIYQQIGTLFAKSRCKKMMNEVKNDLCIDLYNQVTDEQQEIIKLEWENLAKYYFKICLEDKNFSTGILGFFKLKDEEMLSKIADEVSTIAYAVPRYMGEEKEFEAFTDIFTKVFSLTFYNGKQIINEKIEQLKK